VIRKQKHVIRTRPGLGGIIFWRISLLSQQDISTQFILDIFDSYHLTFWQLLLTFGHVLDIVFEHFFYYLNSHFMTSCCKSTVIL
jgi:hypothetical protein